MNVIHIYDIPNLQYEILEYLSIKELSILRLLNSFFRNKITYPYWKQWVRIDDYEEYKSICSRLHFVPHIYGLVIKIEQWLPNYLATLFQRISDEIIGNYISPIFIKTNRFEN